MNDNPYQLPGPEQNPQAHYASMLRSDALVLRRIGVLSVGKVLACLYALLGLIIGAFMSLFALAGVAIEGPERAGPALLVNIAAILFLPILYGALGFLGGALMAALYNLVASFAGGIEVELRSAAGNRTL